jgi:hypothetical protein
MAATAEIVRTIKSLSIIKDTLYETAADCGDPERSRHRIKHEYVIVQGKNEKNSKCTQVFEAGWVQNHRNYRLVAGILA